MLMIFLLGLFSPMMAGVQSSWTAAEPFQRWSLDKAVEVLNNSPWAKQKTFTHVIRGVGSGISGEKEIYNTFYVRFLSARPIREAYIRVQQIRYGYDSMLLKEKRRFESEQSHKLDLDVSKWIVISVGFRSNDPNEESSVRRFFQSHTSMTMKTKAFLSTPACSQVEIAAYFPPMEESVGAKFVFPREYQGRPVVTKECSIVSFELLDIPEANSRFRTTFDVGSMIVGGRVII